MRVTDKKGFTLIELLIGMVISSIATLVIISTYTLQVRSKNTLETLTDMNQATRAAFEIMSSEIRQAGLDPLGTANASIITATQGTLSFSMDRTNAAGTTAPNGSVNDANEIITYSLSNDADDDGINDLIVSGTTCNLGRATGAGVIFQPLARNVDILNFVYLDATGTPINPTTQTLRDSIRSIEMTIVARAGQSSNSLLYLYVNNNTYINLQNAVVLPAQRDSFRRLRLATTVLCRNLGI